MTKPITLTDPTGRTVYVWPEHVSVVFDVDPKRDHTHLCVAGHKSSPLRVKETAEEVVKLMVEAAATERG